MLIGNYLLISSKEDDMNYSNLGPAGRNIIAILNEDYSSLSSAYGSRPTPQRKDKAIEEAQVEYISSITLDEPATPFQQRLAAFGDVPMSTFSILA